MIFKRHIYYSILCTFIVFFAIFSSGCISTIYSSGCININYNNYNYEYLTDWDMISDKYTEKTIRQDGVDLHIRLYDNDLNNQFLFCEDNGSLYHNDAFKLPVNNIDNIDFLTFYLHNSSNDEIVISNNDAKKEFVKIISSKSSNYIDIVDNLLTIAIYYKDFPALNYYGNLVVDSDNKYWIRYSFFDDKDNVNEVYYPVTANSILLSYVKL